MPAPATGRAILPQRVAGTVLSDRRPTLARAKAATRSSRLHWAVVLLLVTWVMPFVIYAGLVRLTPYRIALLVLFVPCVVWLAQGRAGRPRLADALILLFGIWCLVSLTAVHGLGTAAQTGGIQLLETLTPYFLARCCIRNADDFLALARMLSIVVLVLAPFAVLETVTGRNIYVELASYIYPTIGITDKELRWDLRRVQLFFDHPILAGVCLGSILALTHMVWGRELTFMRRWMRSGAVGITAALSLSSGPLGAMILQIGLMIWDRATRRISGRWVILLATTALMLLALQLMAKRPLINILLSYAFEPQSAFFRTLIWEYGTLSVANYPWFGVGMGTWDRPAWMPPSVDMFWLYNAITYGLPGGLLFFGAFAAALISVISVRRLDARHNDYRTAYLIAMASFFAAGWAVHFWNGTYVFFLLLLGSGMWLCDVAAGPVGPKVTARTLVPQSRSVPGNRRQSTERPLDRKLEPVDRQSGRRRDR